MLPAPKDINCYDYLKECTSIYDDVWMMQHFGVKYRKSEIFRDIDALASYFQNDLGLKQGDVYTVFMPTTVQSIIAFYALNSIGVIVNMIHPLMATDFLKEQLEAVHAKGVMVLDLLSKNHVDTINNSGLPCIVCRSSDYSNGFKKFGTKIGEGLIKAIFPKFKKATYYKDALNYDKKPVFSTNNVDESAVYLNGGGTTGKSKTIKLTSRAINELVYRVSDLDEIHDPGNEAEVIVLPLFHCFGLCVAVHMALCNSARIIPMMQFDARIFINLMKKNKVVGIVGIPLMFQKLMRQKGFDGPHLKNMRIMFCGGDDVSEAFIQEFNTYFEKWGSDARLRQGYGLTEIASVCCTNTNNDNRDGSIGKALRGVNIEIWDDDKNPLPDGEIGEIAISGPTIMSGYYTDGEESDDYGLYTDENGVKWVLSGDLGYKDEDGYFHFSGRKKRLILIAGYNVYPTDIEKVVGDLPYIKDCCAVQGYNEAGKPLVRLYASLLEKGDEEKYKEEICELCLKNFSKYYVPRDIIFLEDLPQTPLMKIDFMKLTKADANKARETKKVE
ncbi:MAG: acyl--CoA ligase [Ruminococcaceae bacterium]|nr:acyl--CoA ligase [Oscillospiraceae bacterium]